MRKVTILLLLVFSMAASSMVRSDQIGGSEVKQNVAGHTVSIHGGVSWVTSKLYDIYGTYDGWASGFNCGIDYNFVFGSGFGLGVSCDRNSTSVSGHMVKAWYVGPSFVYRSQFGLWWLGADLGMGYSYCDFNRYDDSGLGMKAAANIEYQISDRFGLMAQIGGVAAFFGGWSSSVRDDDINGISHWGVSLGLCVHF